MLAEWAARYVGIPWLDGGRDRAGCDCWGLLRLVYLEVFGIELPSHREGYATAADAREVSALIDASVAGDGWRLYAPDAAGVGDGLLFRVEGQPAHVGIYVGDGRFLHATPEVGACVERLFGAGWARRFVGAYRHRALEPAMVRMVRDL